jgi:hypothetical protein
MREGRNSRFHPESQWRNPSTGIGLWACVSKLRLAEKDGGLHQADYSAFS